MGTFSTTDRSTFKTCRWMWDKQSLSRKGREHPMPGEALLLGSLVHFALADWIKEYAEGKAGDPKARFQHHFNNAAVEIYRRYERRYGVEMHEEEFEKSYGGPVRDLGYEMIKNYETRWVTPIPQGWSVAGIEQTVTIPVPGTAYCKCEHINLAADYDSGTHGCHHPEIDCALCSTWPCSCLFYDRPGTTCDCIEHHKIEATFDALLLDPKGRLFVMDHKTYKLHPSTDELNRNDQFLAYTWIGNQLGMGQVYGVLYDGLWKRTWEDLLDKPTKTKPGGNPRKKTNGDYYTFEDLFYRTFILHGKAECEDFGRRLPVELNEMGRPDVPIYMNRNWYSCPNCAVAEPCLAQSRGEDTSYLWDEYGYREKTPAWRVE